MPDLKIVLNGDGIAEKEGIDPASIVKPAATGTPIITALRGGMTNGGTSVSFLVPMDDGRTLMIETSLKLLILACEGFVQEYGYPDMSEYGITVPPGEMREKVIANLQRLPLAERRVMQLRFGLDEGGNPRNADQIAAIMNTSPNNVRVLENRALVKLRGMK